MSYRSLFWPITLLATVAVTLVLIFTSAPVKFDVPIISAALACPTDGTNPSYPHCLETQTAEAAAICPDDGSSAYPSEDCLLTQTAILRQTDQASPTSTPTSTGSARSTGTRTPTFTVTPTRPSARTGSPVPTVSQMASIDPISATPTMTPSAMSENLGSDQAPLMCIPGETITIEGSTDPRTALIVTFGGRPVGGSISREDGSYTIWLRIGNERPGLYPVEVEERATKLILQALLCQVPAFTPTPTPSLVP